MEIFLKKLIILMLVCICGSAFADNLDTKKLDELAVKHNYNEIESIFNQYPNADPQVIAWLRLREDDWDPTLLRLLSLNLLASIPKLTPSTQDEARKIFGEMARSFARSKTEYYIDFADCKEKTAQVNQWHDMDAYTAGPLDKAVRTALKSIYSLGNSALDWAKKKRSPDDSQLPPPAIWLCGDGNILPDSDRRVARAQAFQKLEQGLNHVREKDGIGIDIDNQ